MPGRLIGPGGVRKEDAELLRIATEELQHDLESRLVGTTFDERAQFTARSRASLFHAFLRDHEVPGADEIEIRTFFEGIVFRVNVVPKGPMGERLLEAVKELGDAEELEAIEDLEEPS